MCSNLQETPDGKKFWCRVCDECIAARREGWVHRAVAERETSAFTYAVTLTYNDDSYESRVGARFFRYSDVQGLLKRIRDAIYRRTRQHGSLRFMCAGEQGDRNGRCHWHLILFSSYDIATLGKFKGLFGAVTDRDRIVTVHGQKARRLSWSLWPYGFVSVQEPDEGGIRYAVSYALKDSFAHDKARGQKREAKSETYATGYFRVSQTPPIGTAFIDALLERLAASHSVLPSVRVNVPSLKGYWVPVGSLRRKLLAGLRSINDDCQTTLGKDAPQWSTLLASLKDAPDDLEVLGYGQEIEEETIEERIAARRAEADFQRREYAARSCFSILPCDGCLRAASADQLRSVGVELVEGENGLKAPRYIGDETGKRVSVAQKKRSTARHFLCQAV